MSVTARYLTDREIDEIEARLSPSESPSDELAYVLLTNLRRARLLLRRTNTVVLRAANTPEVKDNSGLLALFEMVCGFLGTRSQ